MAESAASEPQTAPRGRIATYAEFWPYYLGEHRRPRTRALHFFGTALGVVVLLGAIVAQAWWFLLAALVCGYLFAWIGHFFVERNRPATFTYPFWSFYSDFRMLGFWLAGRLDGELKRHQIV
ncbi:MAG TPA: DUF962 domain-containing protein [Alphaproteobacteria bacterium]|jgi:hypothetical protein|nr:DUF962 domain-containing protein [Alphaproteobacteria bacterium]